MLSVTAVRNNRTTDCCSLGSNC